MAVIRSIDPTTGAELAVFDQDGEAAIDAKLAAAAASVPALADAGIAQRARWMHAAADLLDADIDSLAETITREMGKPLAQARAEITKSASTMRFYAEHAAAFLEGRSLPDPSIVGASAAFTRYEPLGVVLAVMPWNYPIWQVIRFAAPALMAGNVGVLKHASNVPQTALYLGSLFSRAGFPEGAFTTLLIGSAQVERVIRDRRVVAVTVTGSEAAGRSVASIAADEVKKAVLELGGSDPFIVMPSADLDAAVRTAVTARTTNNGQACINAKRFIVHADVYERFAAGFTAAMRELTVGDPTAEGTDIGPLATEAGREDLEELVEDARAHGASILTGGERPDRAGWFYEPTVIADVTPTMKLFRAEAFGPVAMLYRADSLEDALAVANDSPFGLGAAFWSTDADEIAIAQARIQAGAVTVNGMTISYPELPFGGIKRSGFGRELSVEGIREFCNLKTVWVA